MYSCALLDVEVGNCLEKTHLLPLARGALTHGEVDEIQIIAVPFRSKGRKLAAQNAKSARLSPAHILRLKGPPDSKTHKTPKCRRNAALGETRGAVGCLCTCPWIAQRRKMRSDCGYAPSYEASTSAGSVGAAAMIKYGRVSTSISSDIRRYQKGGNDIILGGKRHQTRLEDDKQLSASAGEA